MQQFFSNYPCGRGVCQSVTCNILCPVQRVVSVGVFQIVVNTGTNATEYEEVEVEAGSRVNRDMAFDHTGDFVYVVTLRKVGHSQKSPASVCVHACMLECVTRLNVS